MAKRETKVIHRKVKPKKSKPSSNNSNLNGAADCGQLGMGIAGVLIVIFGFWQFCRPEQGTFMDITSLFVILIGVVVVMWSCMRTYSRHRRSQAFLRRKAPKPKQVAKPQQQQPVSSTSQPKPKSKSAAVQTQTEESDLVGDYDGDEDDEVWVPELVSDYFDDSDDSCD